MTTPDGGSDPSSAHPRLFFAVWPSPAAVEHLADWLAGHRPADPALRWTRSDRWHLTVAFLGPADPDRMSRRAARLHLPAAEPVRLAGAGRFGTVLWIGLEHGPWLTELAAAVRTVGHPDPAPFRAHLTVGRGRGSAAAPAVRNAVPLLEGYRGPAWTPAELTLVDSVTGPAPRYQVRARWPLPSGPGTPPGHS